MSTSIKQEPGSPESRKRPADAQNLESSARKHPKTCYTDMITVLAGQEEVPFIVHKTNLCQDSSFFKSACSEEAIETIRIPAVEAKTFEIYVQWIYRRDIKPAGAKQPPPADPTAMRSEWIQELLKLYLAGEYLLDDALNNCIIDELAMRTERWAGGKLCLGAIHTNYIWANTKTGCKIRLLVLDSFATSTPAAECASVPYADAQHPGEFFYDLTTRLIMHKENEYQSFRPDIDRRCVYHSHNGVDPKAAAKGCKKRNELLHAQAVGRWPTG
ncbi:hypothetical protein LTR10_001628 [Elasticomyces elasticus]|nr:hypothetical protein LTR10_001628 [Elasticomyces elasticus]KAK4975131.1 hypothetical protein LTR42_004341 [Elasticomyces elasticus]